MSRWEQTPLPLALSSVAAVGETRLEVLQKRLKELAALGLVYELDGRWYPAKLPEA